MGRGRQKAKQQKIARKLKYLTTDTDYDELAKELSAQEPGTGSVDPFSHEEVQYVHDVDDDADAERAQAEARRRQVIGISSLTSAAAGRSGRRARRRR